MAGLAAEEAGSIAQHLLRASAQCRHCNGTADLEYIKDGLTGIHVCPGRYVTRIIAYGKEVDADEFKKFIQGAVQDMGKVENADIRMASRYAWDLGMDRTDNDLVLREAYWTQSYRRTKNDDPDRPALFFCSNRDSFFVQPLTSKETRCPGCRR